MLADLLKHIEAAELKAQLEADIAFDRALVDAVEMEELESADIEPEPMPMWLEPEEKKSSCLECFCEEIRLVLMYMLESKFL